MSWRKLLVFGIIAIFAKYTVGDIMVQLNTNRPINDVSDKFVSFTMKPEDLYEALDGEHRSTVTRMASMLSDAHIKFVGDYYFASEKETHLRNPTKIVWKGFNKWTKAIKWSMVIPVPYTPNNWDPMDTLKILNNSQSVGINNCIWQLGTDFGSSAALDYVTELKTFNLMVDSFRHSVGNWQIMGADISAGSCPDETRRYIEMTRELNAAYGWIESTDTFMGNSLTSALSDQDPALKVLLKQKVPVWLNLPKTNSPQMSLAGEIYEGLDWAQTMGDAANTGFHTIFKHISPEDWETPKYSFYVTALFKKIMGSRVFPARPLGFFGGNNKLYTHCSNDVSGGLAFMVVNKQDTPMQIAIRSTSKLHDTELWQYVLTMSNGQMRLNNKKLNLDLDLEPEIKRKHPKSMLQLKAPALSVSFWVLPNIEMEHCQFTEVDESEEEHDDDDMASKTKRYSSTDRLLKELIMEAAKTSSSSARKVYRHRRSLGKSGERLKRFVLENESNERNQEKYTGDHSSKLPFKRDLFSPERRRAAMQWLSQLMRHDRLNADFPLLRRTIRNSDGYMGPFFMTRDGKKTAFTKKITEIKKPEKKPKRVYEDIEFDEETFFKNVGVQAEPDYIKLPDGDVFIQSIAPNGHEDMDEEEEEEIKMQQRAREISKQKKIKVKKEIVSEMKPLRLLPTEFYEALPVHPSTPLNSQLNLGNAFNNLFFPDSFGKTFGKGTANIFGKTYELKEQNSKPLPNTEPEPENISDDDIESETESDRTSDDFLKAQLNMRETNFKNVNENEQIISRGLEKTQNEPENPPTAANQKTYFQNLLNDKNFNFFGSTTKANGNHDDANNDNDEDNTDDDGDDDSAAGNTSVNKQATQENVKPKTSPKFEELPWWDLSPLRAKRSMNDMDARYSSKPLHTNLITKDEDHVMAGNEISPRRLRAFEYKIDEAVRETKKQDYNDDDSIGKQIVDTFKTHLTKLVNIVSDQFNGWYNTLTKQSDDSIKTNAL